MMFTSISLTALLVFMLVNIQAEVHSRAISDGTMSRKVKVAWSLVRFFLMLGLLCGLAFAGLIGPIQVLLLLTGSMAAFSFCFRRAINLRKKWDVHYLGVSSWYDLFWLWLFCRPGEPRKPSLRWFVANHYGRYAYDWNYRRAVWHAEECAAIAEVGLCIACTVMSICLQGT